VGGAAGQIGGQAGSHGQLLASVARRVGVDAGPGDWPIPFSRVAAGEASSAACLMALDVTAPPT